MITPSFHSSALAPSSTMISIRKHDVPEYLRSSPHFVNSFHDCEDEPEDSELTIEIPVDCLKANLEIQDAIDLRATLQTIRFWLVPELIEDSMGMFAFACSNVGVFHVIAHEYGQDFPFLVKIHNALHPTGKLTIMGGAAQFGLLGLIKHLVSQGASWETGANMHLTAIAARQGHLDCLQYAAERGCRPTQDACSAAADGGHLDCLKYIHEHGAPVNVKALDAAVRAGQLPCVKFIMSQGVLGGENSERFCEVAARAGNKDMLAYLIDMDCGASLSVANAAAAYDRIECLELLHRVGCPITSETTFTAVHCGSLQCLKFLHSIGCGWDPKTITSQPFSSVAKARNAYYETFPTDKVVRTFLYAAEHGCPVTEKSMVLAATFGSVEFVEYLYSRGTKLSSVAFRAALAKGYGECMKYFFDHGFPVETESLLESVRCGCLASVQCLHENGVAWDATVTTMAVQLNKANVLMYLVQHGCPVAEDAIVQAAALQHIECLKCLHEHGATMAQEVVSAACRSVATQCLEYALSQGCPYSEDDCVFAASKGHLSTLACLHEHGAPMTPAIVTAALKEGHIDCVEYAVAHASTDLGPVACSAAATRKSSAHLKQLLEQGSVWDANTCLTAIRCGSFECLKYAVKNGCPFDDCTLLAEAALHGRRDMLKWLHKKGIAWDARTTAAAVRSDSLECLEYAIQRHCPFDVTTEMLEQAPSCEAYMAERGHDINKRALLRQVGILRRSLHTQIV